MGDPTSGASRPPARGRRRAPLALLLALAVTPVALAAAPAQAATTTIDYVQPDGEDIGVLVSLEGAPAGVVPDLGTVTVTLDGTPMPAEATLAENGSDTLTRTTVLTMDVSRSMAGTKFTEARAAAEAFLDTVPDDVRVGLVTFAADVEVVRQPTQDHASVRTALESLELSRETSLYDGVVAAVEAAGRTGARSLLVLSDGANTTGTTLERALRAVSRSKVKLDVVALAQDETDTALLQRLADAGQGSVLPADDPEALTSLFAAEAEALAQQVLVTVTPPAELQGREGTLAVTLQVDDEPIVDEAFVSLPAAQAVVGGGEVDAVTPVERGLSVPRSTMLLGLGIATLGVLGMLVALFGGNRREQDELDSRIEAYTRKGAKKLAQAQRSDSQESSSMTQQAVAVAESMLEGQKGLEAALGARLEAAGMALKPAEWLLVHVGVLIGSGVAGLLLGGGSTLFLAVGLLAGLVLPAGYLALKKKRRLASFGTQLADTLQLMAGALSAGLSLPQGVDTVVNEGSDPMAAECRRALVEARLGVSIEDALLGVAQRMQSKDFEWVVMAIRIQREVGGNLSELLNKVAETIREREYLERQVKALSAEGRLSVWVLGGLPPAFLAYLAVASPAYVDPLFHQPLGWMMLGVMSVLLVVGVLWMKKLVKVEV